MGLKTSTDRRELALDAAVALLALGGWLAIQAAIGANNDEARGLDALTVTLTVLGSLPLIARRRAPLAVFVVTALASIALNGVTVAAGPPIGPTIALYWLAAASDGTRARTRQLLVLVAVLLLLHLTAGAIATDVFPGMSLLFGVVVWGGAWLAGDRTRMRRVRMAELEERAERAEQEAERERRLAAAEERMRIARDLHDSAGHAINVILVHAGLGRLRSEGDPSGVAREFETIEQVARETVGEIDQMVAALRDDDGAAEVEPAGLAALNALVARHRAAGMEVVVDVHGERRPLPAAVDRGAYRILQEALTNAARYGDGRAEVVVSYDTRALELSVANAVWARGRGGGHGVVGMRERADLLGGTLDAGARDGRYLVHARLPLAGARGVVEASA